ncbi:MAG: glycosyltransferase family 4 protein [Bacteroidales bacterium]|nr:glycosyltransferase family 4 protein [Bacteroidales bacterium]
MRIAVNTRLLLKGKLEGIGWVACETLKRIVRSHPEVEFYFIFDRKPDPMFLFADNVKPVVLFPQARHPFLFIWFFEWSVPRLLRKIKADLFYSPDGYLSLRSKVPQVVEFHDLNFEHFPGDMPKIHLWHYKKYFPKFAQKAKRIVTVSEFSKQDIVDCYGVSPDKIDVAYNGVNGIFKPLSEAEKSVVRAYYSFGHPYFMFVDSLHPRKNLARLFTAFDRFKQRHKNDVKLVIVGEKRWWTEPIQQAYDAMSCKEEVVFAGRLSQEDLHKVTAAALASVYVSYFEGFGIPILEAFKCDTPVITSNVTSMPEVARDAALLVNPFDEDAIAAAMAKVLDEDVRKELIAKGRLRANDFSWDYAAEVIWNSMATSPEAPKVDNKNKR